MTPGNTSLSLVNILYSTLIGQYTRKGVKPEDDLLAQTNKDRKPRNTETFRPSHEPTEMRVMFSSGVPAYPRPIQTRDVIFVPDMFCAASDLSIYNNLLSELEHSGLTQHQVMLASDWSVLSQY